MLKQAYLQIDKYEKYVGYEKRLEDIKIRYGEGSTNYINCKTIVDNILERGI